MTFFVYKNGIILIIVLCKRHFFLNMISQTSFQVTQISTSFFWWQYGILLWYICYKTRSKKGKGVPAAIWGIHITFVLFLILVMASYVPPIPLPLWPSTAITQPLLIPASTHNPFSPFLVDCWGPSEKTPSLTGWHHLTAGVSSLSWAVFIVYHGFFLTLTRSIPVLSYPASRPYPHSTSHSDHMAWPLIYRVNREHSGMTSLTFSSSLNLPF